MTLAISSAVEWSGRQGCSPSRAACGVPARSSPSPSGHEISTAAETPPKPSLRPALTAVAGGGDQSEGASETGVDRVPQLGLDPSPAASSERPAEQSLSVDLDSKWAPNPFCRSRVKRRGVTAEWNPLFVNIG
jgi:hypothetical protein